MNLSKSESKIDRTALVVLAVILAVVLAMYWSVLMRLSKIWSSDSDYSHGYLVPVFSAFLLYRTREQWLPCIESAKSWWAIGGGAGLVSLALAMRAGGILGRSLSLEGASLAVLLAGIVCFLGGGRMVWITSAALAFLLFMLPIPAGVNEFLRGELQKYATQGSVFVMQTLGLPASNQGNVIKLPNSEVGVVEACSGLRILASLGAMAFAVCVLMEKRWLNRILIFASVIPIALAVNISRIVVTAIGHEYWPTQAERIHDIAGWLMIGMAVLLLVAVQRYFDALFPDVSGTESSTRPRTPAKLAGSST
ncbi:MAG: exosortase/archaeosortase family protein [Planctomycetota bacterium]|jgi:exosortase